MFVFSYLAKNPVQAIVNKIVIRIQLSAWELEGHCWLVAIEIPRQKARDFGWRLLPSTTLRVTLPKTPQTVKDQFVLAPERGRGRDTAPPATNSVVKGKNVDGKENQTGWKTLVTFDRLAEGQEK